MDPGTSGTRKDGPMFALEIGRLIHDERKREIERTLTIRRLLRRDPVDAVEAEPRPCAEPAVLRRRHEPAGATS
jgi:hypothetical protein